MVVATLKAAPEASLNLPKSLPNDARVFDLLGQAAESTPRLFLGRLDLLPVGCLSGVQLLTQLLERDGAVQEFGSLIPQAMETCWNELVHQASDWDFEAEDDEDDHAQVLMASLVRYPSALQWLWPVLDRAVKEQQWLPSILALEAAWDGAPRGSMEHFQTATAVALASPLCGVSVRLLGLLCEHATLIEDSSSTIVRRLIEACSSRTTARWACDALTGFVQGKKVDEQTIAPYLTDVLTALSGWPMSEHSNNGIKMAALGTVACWATVAGNSFSPFYPQLVPTLLQMISTQNLDEELMSACLETATVIGQAVPEVFLPDAHRILQLIPFHQEQPSYVYIACARIASVVKESYAPYLEKIMPQLLARLTDPSSDLEFSKGDWQSSEQLSADGLTIALPGQGLTKVTINTSKIQEKAQLARAAYEHVVAVGSLYGPYCESSLEVFLPLVEFRYSSDVRGSAAQTVAAIFEASCMAGEESGTMATAKKFLARTLDTLSRQLEVEDATDMEVFYAVADALSDTSRMMYLYGPTDGADMLGGVSEKEIEVLVSRSMAYVSASLKRRSDLMVKKSSTAGPDLIVEIEKLLEQEEDLLTPLVDSVGWLLKTYKESFVDIFEKHVVPVLGNFLHSGNDVRATLSSVCLFDDCIEFCGVTAAAKYSPLLLQGVLRGLSSDVNDDDLKRAAIYGIAQMARYAPSLVLEPQARWIVQNLSQIAGNPEQHSDAVYENSLSALASMVLFHNAPFVRSGFLKRELVLQQFMAALPLTVDEDEAKICHAGLCDLVEAGEAIDLGMIARVAEEIVTRVQREEEDLATPETCERLLAIFQHCKQAGGMPDSFSRTANIVSP